MEEAATHRGNPLFGVGEKAAKPDSKSGFWPVSLETISGGGLQKEDAEHVDELVREVTGWSDPVEESIGFVEAACKNYEALIDERQAGKNGERAHRGGTRREGFSTRI